MTDGAAPRRVLLGLGSNLGDRLDHLRRAVAALAEQDEVTAVSDVYDTDPVGGPDQGRFLNLVVALRTARSPHELLGLAQDLEAAAGRVREVRWGPRPLDVDILWIDGEEVDEADLTVPHPRMHERAFVLVPLADVAPDIASSAAAASPVGIRRLGSLGSTAD